MEEENVQAENSNQQEEVVLESTNEESSAELAARLAKAEELANNYKVRAEKAERLAKASKEVPQVQQQAPNKAGEISTKDLYALMEARVPQEDISEVQEYAQLKGISISEALKATVVKSILNEKAEQRTVASATNVGATKRGSGKVSDETLISKAAKGELPDNDDDMIRLIKARKGLK